MNTVLVILVAFIFNGIVEIQCGSNDHEECLFEVDEGYPCEESMDMEPYTQWYYNVFLGYCMEFEYRGCGGNENKFPDEVTCTTRCNKSGDPRPDLTGIP